MKTSCPGQHFYDTFMTFLSIMLQRTKPFFPTKLTLWAPPVCEDIFMTKLKLFKDDALKQFLGYLPYQFERNILATKLPLWAPLVCEGIFMTKLNLSNGNALKQFLGHLSYHFERNILATKLILWAPLVCEDIFMIKLKFSKDDARKQFLGHCLIILKGTFLQQSWHFESPLSVMKCSWKSRYFLMIML